ncbi:MAG: hypothetical protein ACLPWS_12065 [Rhodomicrobium sp.]
MAKTEFLQLSINDLLLDLENPRLGSLANQSEALEAIIQLNQKHFKILAQSIKTHGLDPGDSLYVLAAEESDDYTVVEGNRRLSVLMVLNNPAVLESTSLSTPEKKALGSLAAGFRRSAIEPIRCTLFQQRSEANEWIYRRHTGAAEGEGRINWGPLEIQRFAGDRTVLDVIEFMHRNGRYSPEDWGAVHEALANNSSILGRFLESKACREFLGLSTRKAGSRTIPEFTAAVPFVVQALRHLFDDIQKGRVNTRTHNKAGEIEAYFANLRDSLTPSKPRDPNTHSEPRDPKPKAFRDVNQIADSPSPQVGQPGSPEGTPAATAPEAQARPKTTRTRAERVNLAPRSHEFKQPQTTKGKALVREASSLNADEFPLASAYLLRSFLEHTIDGYMTANNIPRWENNKELSLQARAERVIQHIVDNKLAAANELRGVKANLTSKGDPASVQSLNDYHHATYRIPTADTLRAAWESAVPLFIAVYGKA